MDQRKFVLATIDADRFTLAVRVPGTKPTITADAGPPVGFKFDSPTIDLDASSHLRGAIGESVAGWSLGFIQLKYIGTNHARYRGATIKDGSALLTHSNRILCRDTDIGSTEIWYDSIRSGGTTGPMGTNKLAPGTILPATKTLPFHAHLYDRPSRWWASVRPNGHAAGNPNFLHYVVVELLFCTMLVAQDPAGNNFMLKHVYWNVIWEQTFKRDGAGHVVLDKSIRLQQNIQHPVHSGSPRDPKFLGREYDLTLPVSNTVTRQAPRIVEVSDWSEG
jgi:hypothetical protein